MRDETILIKFADKFDETILIKLADKFDMHSGHHHIGCSTQLLKSALSNECITEDSTQRINVNYRQFSC